MDASLIQLRARAEVEMRIRRSMKADGRPRRIDLESYQADPAAFGRDVLGERFTDDVIRVMESVRDNPVTIAKSANATGKTHGAARIAVWFYKVYPDAQVYTTAAPPERNLRRLLWGEIGSIINKHPGLFAGDRIRADMNVERGPQSFITGVSIPMAGTPEQREAKFSGKHAPHMLFLVDEADAVPPEVFRGIESCMSGGFARLLVMFNPRADVGPIAQMERQKRGFVVSLSAFDHPNVRTGNDVIPGAVSREKTVRRINEWSRPLAPGETHDIECFQVPEFLVGATATGLDGQQMPPLPAGWRKVTNPQLFYMVMGIYPPQAETQLINRAWVDAATTRWLSYVAQHGERPPSVLQVIAGLDVAEYGPDSNAYCRRYGGWVAPISCWSGLDPDTTAIHTAGLARDEPDPITCMVDATGIGAAVPARMRRLGIDTIGIKVASAPTIKTEDDEEFGLLRDQLWWMTREWLRRDPGAMLPPDEALAEELCAPKYVIMNGKIKVTPKDELRELIGRSTDRADALCLTFSPHQSAEYGDAPTKGYRG